MMKISFEYIIKLVRLKAWWKPILAFLLGFIYVSTLYFDLTFDQFLHYFPLFFIIIIGTASFGFFLNDYTDIEEDKIAGKKNRVAQIPKNSCYLVFCLLLLVIYLPAFFLLNYPIALFFISLQLLFFVIYSVKPVRLRNKIVASLVLDTLYNNPIFLAFIFLILQSYKGMLLTKQDFLIISLFLFWGVLKGFRNIIMHQLNDRKNDLKANRITIAHQLGTKLTLLLILAILIIEIIVFLIANFLVSGYLLLGILLVIFIYLFKTTYPLINKQQYKQSCKKIIHFPNFFYEECLPYIALLLISIKDYRFMIICILHILLFLFTERKFYHFLHKITSTKK